MKKLFTYFSNSQSSLGNSQSSAVGYDCRSTVVRPSFDRRSTLLKLVSVLVLILTVGVGNAWGDAAEVYKETFGSTSSNTAYGSYSGFYATTSMFSTSGTVKSHYSGSGSVGKNNLAAANLSNGYTGASGLSGCYHTGTANTQATIIQISDINISGYSNLHLSFGALGGASTHKVIVTYKIDNGSETTLISSGSITNASWTLIGEDIASTGSSLTIYIKHKPTKAWTIRLDDITVTGCPAPKTLSNGTITSSTARLTWADADDTGSYEVYRSTENSTPGANPTPTTTVSTKHVDLEDLSASTTYHWWVRSKCSNTNKSAWVAGTSFTTSAGVSCSSNPEIGNASLNGSVSLTSVPFSCPVTSEGGAGCSITDAGFVWKSGSEPSASDNKTTGIFSTNITGTIPSAGSFSTGVTYYVKAYATNGNGTTLSGTYQYRVQSVTFNGNTSTSGSMSTQYVEYNKSTALTSNAFSKTGHTFAGWATSAGGDVAYSNGQSVSATGDLSLYAKWSAKQCTVNFDIEGGTGTITGVTATYGQAMPSKESNLPTKTGYDFGGFWDGDGGTGTQYYNADGTSKINWNKDVTATQTLYAKWTAKSYTITWKVNGEEWSGKGGSTSANYNSAWSSLTLPTAPDPENDGCGQKFVGWTESANYSNATTAPSDLLNADNKSGKTAVLITDNVEFHAVFADYDEP